MIKFYHKVNNKNGIHLRPAGILASEAKKHDCDCYLIHNGNKVFCKDFLRVVAECIKFNEEVTFVCDGKDEKLCADKIKTIIENHF